MTRANTTASRPPRRASLLIVALWLVLLAGCSATGSPSLTPASIPTGTATAGSAAASATPSLTPSPTTTPPPTATTALRYVFPVRSKAARYGRYHHDYPATDIFAPCGSPVLATIGGQVAEVSRTDRWSSRTDLGADRGGRSVSLIGVDGVRYYASHLRSIPKSVVSGARLTAGQVIGATGNTGDARGIACHVHYGISPNCGTGDWWNRRGVVSPYRFLRSWQVRHELSPVATVKAWRAAHGCPKGARADP